MRIGTTLRCARLLSVALMVLVLHCPCDMAIKPGVDSSTPGPISGLFSWARGSVKLKLSVDLNPMSFRNQVANNVILKLKPVAGAALLPLIFSAIKPEKARSEGNNNSNNNRGTAGVAFPAVVQFGSINITDLVGALSMGQVYCAEQFIDAATVRQLRDSVLGLQQSTDRFKPSGLSNKAKGAASQQNFGANDRMVSAVTANDIDTNPTLSQIVNEMNSLRAQLGATCVNRPSMGRRDLNHELYYSLSLKGAHLKRHLDERHEELKGRRGWMEPSRRSVSWLLYLCDSDWDVKENGGELRSFHPSVAVRNGPCGSHEGDLQIAWLAHSRSSGAAEDFAEPVFLDCWNRAEGMSSQSLAVLYTLSTGSDAGPDCAAARATSFIRRPIAQAFPLHEGSTGVTIRDFGPFLLDQTANAPVLALLEDLALPELESQMGDSLSDPIRCSVRDTSPRGGSLVVFDSVCVPHEVRTTISGQRVALAGWFHEEVQSFPDWVMSSP